MDSAKRMWTPLVTKGSIFVKNLINTSRNIRKFSNRASKIIFHVDALVLSYPRFCVFASKVTNTDQIKVPGFFEKKAEFKGTF